MRDSVPIFERSFASMFVTVAIVYGLSFDIIGLFYNSLAKEFGLSRAKFLSLATSFSLSFLVGGLVAGWLLDRIGAQFVVVAGAMMVIAGSLVASAASFNAMLLAYFLIGLGAPRLRPPDTQPQAARPAAASKVGSSAKLKARVAPNPRRL